ncbi:hypothetical protein ACFWI0_20800, partial [[Kitasatospora] papulosa]
MATRNVRVPDASAADGVLSRRRLLRMAGVGLGLVVAGAVTTACGPEEDGASGGTGEPKPGGGTGGGGAGQAPTPPRA